MPSQTPTRRLPCGPPLVHAGPRRGLTGRQALVPLLIVLLLLILLPLLIGNPRPQATTQPATQPTTLPATTQPGDVPPGVTRDAEGRLVWPRPRFDDRQRERDRMVETQIAADSFFRDGVTDGRVLAALRAVPRHEFVPAHQGYAAYGDHPLPIGHRQTISQPYIVALMTELLNVRPGDRVLEIGTGSGYQAAVLNELTPFVYTIEIVEPLAREAAERLRKLGYVTVQTRIGDGYLGWAEHGPFDSIIVTCGAARVPEPLWQQLKPGGRMVIPVGEAHAIQELQVIEKRADGTRQTRSVIPVRFVPMTGEAQRE